MSLAALIALAGNLKRVDPNGREYHSKVVCGADKGHWLVEYSYRIQGGHQVTSFWERMTDNEMRKTQCFADDYTGPRTRA